jgi:hypothetical protein
VIRCVFRNNWAGGGGAIGSVQGSQPLIKQCLLFDNAAASNGAAIAGFGAMLTLTNCTITGNKAGFPGAGVWSAATGSLRMDNCILWSNVDSSGAVTVEVAQMLAGSNRTEVNYCCVQGWTGMWTGTDSFGLNPLFADPDNSDFHLRSAGGRWDAKLAQWVYDTVTSPCIDAGDPALPLGDEPVVRPDAPIGAQATNTRINVGAYGGTAEASVASYD